MKKKCWFVDLTHTAQGVHSRYFPLGMGLVAAYASEKLSDTLDIQLFKFPEELERKAKEDLPEILCFSNYAWNLELTYTFIGAYKKLKNNVIIIMGGPNFPTDNNERKIFLDQYSLVDFYIYGEGEEAVVNLLSCMISNNFSIDLVKKNHILFNCVHLYDGNIFVGGVERIRDLNNLPSPYLSKMFDKYFEMNLMPLYETTRGCPFECTFCSDGISYKNKIRRYSQVNIDSNLEYIARKTDKVDTLTISDLNFGMYNKDLDTAKSIASLREKYNYPSVINASAGKSKFKNILDTITILDGSWTVSTSVQSTDKEVLEHIKRKNLPSSKMQLIAELSERSGFESFSEIILALPMDSRTKHYNSLKSGVDAGLSALRMYQLMLLIGTEMSSNQSRRRYSLQSKHRIMPGCSGQYEFFGNIYNIAEVEEIVIANNTLSYEDYVDCRIMDLFVEIFINGAIFNELFNVLDYFSLSRFDCILRIRESESKWTNNVIDIIDSFKYDTQKDLFDSHEEVKKYVETDGTIQKHLRGESGNNEMLDHKVLSYLQYGEFAQLLYSEIILILKEKSVLEEVISSFVYELKEFIILLKDDFRNNHTKKAVFAFDFSEPTIDLQIKSFQNDKYRYKIYHSEEQKNMINNLLEVFSTKNMMGLGRLIQKTNMKLLYRKFEVNPVNQE